MKLFLSALVGIIIFLFGCGFMFYTMGEIYAFVLFTVAHPESPRWIILWLLFKLIVAGIIAVLPIGTIFFPLIDTLAKNKRNKRKPEYQTQNKTLP